MEKKTFKTCILFVFLKIPTRTVYNCCTSYLGAQAKLRVRGAKLLAAVLSPGPIQILSNFWSQMLLLRIGGREIPNDVT